MCTVAKHYFFLICYWLQNYFYLFACLCVNSIENFNQCSPAVWKRYFLHILSPLIHRTVLQGFLINRQNKLHLFTHFSWIDHLYLTDPLPRSEGLGFDSQCCLCVEVSGKLCIPHSLSPPGCNGYLVYRSKVGSILGLSDQCPWASIRKRKFSEEQCWRQIEALGYYLAVWATIWQWYCEDWVRVRNI